jgi:hypothetical protein
MKNILTNELKDLMIYKLRKNALVMFARFLFCLSFSTVLDASAQNDPSKIKFPVPKGFSNQLFYLQRDPNTNTIICSLNYDADGKLVEDEPVKVYWVRYADNGEIKDLNYIQRKFAYGIQSEFLGNNQYKLNFVSYKKFPMFLVKSEKDNKYHVYVTVNNKKIKLERIFLRIEGGSFWVPNVKYVEVKGTNSLNDAPVTERLKV